MGQARAFQAILAQVQATQVGSAEIGVGEVDALNIQGAQVEAAEIATAKIDRRVRGLDPVELSDLLVADQGEQLVVQLAGLVHGGASSGV